MQTPATPHPFQPTLPKIHGERLWTRFMTWTESQERNRLAWTAIILTGHGCIITIATLLAIIYAGNAFIFWPFAIGAMAASLIVNLAALPTRITIPVFIGSLLIDLTIIALCLMHGFHADSVLI
jgi:hypothetical protein